MSVSLKNYNLKYLIVALLFLIAIWASLFYAFILDEVYDNVDDGLRDQKIQIIRASYNDEHVLNQTTFELAQYRIHKIDEKEYSPLNRFYNQKFFMEYDDEMEPYRVLQTAFIDKDKNYRSLEIRTSTVEEDDLIQDLTVALVVLYLVIILSMLVINHFLQKRAFHPFYGTLNELKKYEFGKAHEIDLPKTEITEFSTLNNEVIRMIERNEAIFIQQKQFIENASHELQTPLAIAINKMDLLLDSEVITTEQSSEINMIKKYLLRLTYLNKSLLMLSKIENKQFHKTENIHFNILIHNLLEDASDVILFKKIRFNLREEADFYALINPDLVSVLISNLLRNAVKHTPKGGEITIVITSEKIIFENSATGFSLNEQQIFNRFYKQSTDSSSTGLGLSIVKSIIENNSALVINYIYQTNFHQFILEKTDS